MAEDTQHLSHHSTTIAILVEYYVLFFVALILVATRIYVRFRIVKDWKLDDLFIVIAWIFLLIGLVLIQIEANLGLGKHVYDLKGDPERKVLDILKFNTFFQMVNVLCTLFTKYSISIFILRIRDSRGLRWVLGLAMLFMTLATLAVIVVLSVSCRPLEKLWTPELSGSCIPLKTVYICAYVQSGFTIVVDLCLTVSPIIILWNVQVKRGRKSFICFLMSLGLIATISNALRNDFQKQLTSKDMPYDITAVSVVAILELTTGIFAACVPAIMPIINWRRRRMLQGTTNYYANSGGGSYMMAHKSTSSEHPQSSVVNERADTDDNVSVRPLTHPQGDACSEQHAW